MKHLYLLALLFGCTSVVFRPDQAPSPIDPAIAQARLEFHGCGKEAQIGTIACLPGQEISILTEFPGDVLYFSSGKDCSIRREVRATPPYTKIEYGEVSSICALTIYYLPAYPGRSTEKIDGIMGEVSLQPDDTYKPTGNFNITTLETIKVAFEGILGGAYTSRQLLEPVRFEKNMIFRPIDIGNDLLQVKLWRKDGTVENQLYTANYFSPDALQLRFDIERKSLCFRQGLKPCLVLEFPAAVSLVTVNGLVYNNLKIEVPVDYTGYVRAYTVKGRTVVSKFEKGVLIWTL